MKEDRYLLNFDTEKMYGEYYDVIIIGSGIAGVYTALEVADKYNVAILTKDTIDISNSVLAQGGIAVSLGKEDSTDSHFEDTLYAGAGLCNEDSVRFLVEGAVKNIERVCDYGVQFDRTSANKLSLTREGAHSQNRIIHAGDSTGKEVLDKLIIEVNKKLNVYIKERTWVVDILTVSEEGGNENTAKGIIVYDEDSDDYRVYYSNIIICASGGYGYLYRDTTNPAVSTGDGAAMAYRAGADLMDVEFIQFHPTVLQHPKNKNFLISEAVRGEGARLINHRGEFFMEKYHPLKDLAPRDVVSRAIFQEMTENNLRNVYLDITFKDREWLEKRFPMIFRTCLGYGIDMSKDYIPVAPSQHYCMGGIKTDIYGRTTIKGFYACGESACNGIHGANRLASNSLLECLVYGRRCARYINQNAAEPDKTPALFGEQKHAGRLTVPELNALEAKVKKIMSTYAGAVRTADGLLTAEKMLEAHAETLKDKIRKTPYDFKIYNMIQVSRLIVDGALKRKDSIGAHYIKQ